MEMIDGNYAFIHGTNNFTYMMLTTLEETLEMVGIAVFVYSLLMYLGVDAEEVKIIISER